MYVSVCRENPRDTKTELKAFDERIESEREWYYASRKDNPRYKQALDK